MSRWSVPPTLAVAVAGFGVAVFEGGRGWGFEFEGLGCPTRVAAVEYVSRVFWFWGADGVDFLDGFLERFRHFGDGGGEEHVDLD